MKNFIAAALIVSTQLTWAASTEGDRLAKIVQAVPKTDDARTAQGLVDLMFELTQRSKSAKHFADRRQFDMLTNDLQDAMGKLNSPEAQKVFAAALLKVQPEMQVPMCFGLSSASANPDVDAAALKLLDPKAEHRIKVAAMEVLSRHRKMEAVDKILTILTADAFPSVQIAACRALAYLPDKKSIPALIKYMESFKQRGNGRLIYEACAALRTITGQKIEADAPVWLKWWNENQGKLVLDSNPKSEPEFNYELSADSEVNYYGIPIVEQKFVFVIDMSGSMKLGGNPNRLESAVADLKRIIGKLDAKQSFNIIAFASGTNRWQRKDPLVPANDLNKKEACKFLDSLHALGGTQTTDVLEDVIRDIASVQGCEAIYLLTDGAPNPWSKEITSVMQSRYITWYNQAWKVRINTIGVYTVTEQEKKSIAKNEDTDGMKEYLYFIASNNDGQYREIDGAKKPEKDKKK